MARLGDSDIQKTKQIFQKYDVDVSHSLDVSELSQCFMETIHPNVSREEIESLADAWAHDGSGKINLDSFIAIMARFIRKHQPDWEALGAFQEILGTDNFTQARVTVPMLLHRAEVESCPLTDAEAREMLWAAGVRNKRAELAEDVGIDFGSFMTFVCAFLGKAKGQLPPPPKRTERQQRRSQMLVAISEFRVLPKPLSSAKEIDISAKATDAAKSANPSVYSASTSPMKRGQSTAWAESTTEEEEEELSVPNTCRARLHLLLEEPTSSSTAASVSIVMLGTILLSVFILVLEPLVSGQSKDKYSDAESSAWTAMEIIFTVIFTIELLLRAIVADALGTRTFWSWLRDPGTICDIAAVVPYFLDLVLDEAGSSFKMLRVIRVLRIGRVMRVSRMAKATSKVLKMDAEMVTPILVVLVVIWGIYLKNSPDK